MPTPAWAGCRTRRPMGDDSTTGLAGIAGSKPALRQNPVVLLDHVWLLLPAMVIVAGVLGFLEDSYIRRAGRRHGECPGCGKGVFRAYLQDGEPQFFDSIPVPVTTPDTALFVFNPTERVTRWRETIHVRDEMAMTIHHCALRRKRPGLTWRRRSVPWRLPPRGSSTFPQARPGRRLWWRGFAVGLTVAVGLSLLVVGAMPSRSESPDRPASRTR